MSPSEGTRTEVDDCDGDRVVPAAADEADGTIGACGGSSAIYVESVRAGAERAVSELGETRRRSHRIEARPAREGLVAHLSGSPA